MTDWLTDGAVWLGVAALVWIIYAKGSLLPFGPRPDLEPEKTPGAADPDAPDPAALRLDTAYAEPAPPGRPEPAGEAGSVPAPRAEAARTAGPNAADDHALRQ